MNINKSGFFLYFLLCLIVIFPVIGCNSSNPAPINTNSPIGQVLQGEHEIRAIGTTKNINGELHGGYFVFAGSVDGAISQQTELTFAWKGNNGDYIFTSLPISEIHLRIDDSRKIPAVRFRWRASLDGTVVDGNSIKSHVIYALIICNENDLPQQDGHNIQNVFKNN